MEDVYSGFSIDFYPIFFKVNVQSFQLHKIIKVVALLPPDYPNTMLKQEFEGQVAEVHLKLQIDNITVTYLRVYSSIRTYILRGQYPDMNEVQSTKGLGKAILCFAIQYAWTYFGENFIGSFSNLIVDLETNATFIYELSEFDIMIEQNRYINRAEIIDQFIEWFPMLDATKLYDKLSQKNDHKLYKLYTEHKENRQLADYYHRTYGFEHVPIDDPYVENFGYRLNLNIVDSSLIVMKASGSTIFEYCSR
jgi:hypothetical protein